MAHWKSMMERDYMYAFDLQGRDVTVTIQKVAAGELVGQGGKKTKKPLVWFAESKSGKPLGMNTTNCKTVAAMYGNDCDRWVGKRITLYPTTCSSPEGTVECIRVRPTVPPEKAAAQQQAADPAEEVSDA